jgi:hypothetical protein
VGGSGIPQRRPDSSICRLREDGQGKKRYELRFIDHRGRVPRQLQRAMGRKDVTTHGSIGVWVCQPLWRMDLWRFCWADHGARMAEVCWGREKLGWQIGSTSQPPTTTCASSEEADTEGPTCRWPKHGSQATQAGWGGPMQWIRPKWRFLLFSIFQFLFSISFYFQVSISFFKQIQFWVLTNKIILAWHNNILCVFIPLLIWSCIYFHLWYPISEKFTSLYNPIGIIMVK